MQPIANIALARAVYFRTLSLQSSARWRRSWYFGHSLRPAAAVRFL